MKTTAAYAVASYAAGALTVLAWQASPFLIIFIGVVIVTSLFWGWVDYRETGYWENPFEFWIALWFIARAGFDRLRRSNNP